MTMPVRWFMWVPAVANSAFTTIVAAQFGGIVAASLSGSIPVDVWRMMLVASILAVFGINTIACAKWALGE